MAHPKHGQVRQRYGFRCGYCGVTETNTGGELTVDHYRPVSAGGSDEDDNLIYACMRCNLYKHDYWPSAAQQAQGLRILHPLLDDAATHLREETFSGVLEAITETGHFHIETLQLNRPELVSNRLERTRRLLALEVNTALRAENNDVWTLVADLVRYSGELEQQLGFRSPDEKQAE